MEFLVGILCLFFTLPILLLAIAVGFVEYGGGVCILGLAACYYCGGIDICRLCLCAF